MSRTRNLSVTSPILYHYITAPTEKEGHDFGGSFVRGFDVLLICLIQVQATEERLGQVTTVSVDREVLGEQIEDQQTLAVDIENRRPRVHALSETCLPQDRAAVDELLDRFDVLQTRCEERGRVLDSVVTRLTELQSGVRQVDTWIGATLNALKHDRSADRDPNSLKNRIEGLSFFTL